MIISSGLLSIVVTIALAVTIIAPVALIILWIKDWVNKQLW